MVRTGRAVAGSLWDVREGNRAHRCDLRTRPRGRAYRRGGRAVVNHVRGAPSPVRMNRSGLVCTGSSPSGASVRKACFRIDPPGPWTGGSGPPGGETRTGPAGVRGRLPGRWGMGPRAVAPGSARSGACGSRSNGRGVRGRGGEGEPTAPARCPHGRRSPVRHPARARVGPARDHVRAHASPGDGRGRNQGRDQGRNTVNSRPAHWPSPIRASPGTCSFASSAGRLPADDHTRPRTGTTGGPSEGVIRDPHP